MVTVDGGYDCSVMSSDNIATSFKLSILVTHRVTSIKTFINYSSELILNQMQSPLV